MTKEQIKEAIENCKNLSNNQNTEIAENTCTQHCKSCSEVVRSGQCKMLQQLFKKEAFKQMSNQIKEEIA